MIKNFALITYSFEGASIAKRFRDEIGDGGQVIVGVIEDTKDIYLPMEREAMKHNGKDPSSEDNKERRLHVYDGILRVYGADSVVEYLKNRDDKEEWFVFCDMNYCFKYAEILSEFMPYGNFPTAKDRELEVDRDMAKDFIKQNYPDVAPDHHFSFEQIDECEEYLESCDEIMVLKGDNVDAPTVVPSTDDVDVAREILIDALRKNSDKYNSGGMILEVKLDDAVEITPEMCFYDGEPIYSTVDIETKRKYAGDVGGELVGCGTDLVFQTKLDDKINEICFPRAAHEWAKRSKGMVILDLSLLISKRTGTMYPGEFCANRPGWNSFMTEMDGVGAVKFFNDLVKGRNPIKGKKFSSSLRVFNDEAEAAGVKIIFPPEIEKHVWLMDAIGIGDDLYSAGVDLNLGVITGSGDTFEESAKNLYSNAEKFALATKRWGYRSYGDYLDDTYSSAIVNRYNYAVEKGLVSGYEAFKNHSSKS